MIQLVTMKDLIALLQGQSQFEKTRLAQLSPKSPSKLDTSKLGLNVTKKLLHERCMFEHKTN